MKRSILATIAVFIALAAMDFVIHGILLDPAYQATAHLWRPEAEIKMGLMMAVTLIFSAGLVAVYHYFIQPKSVKTGLLYGVLLGITLGTSGGIGFYCFMPIPMDLAMSWFAAYFVELTVAGLIIGAIIKANAPVR